MDEDLSEWEREIMGSPAYQKVYRSVRKSQAVAYERRARSRPAVDPVYNLLDSDEDLIELEEHPPLTAISYSKQLENEFLAMAGENIHTAGNGAGSDTTIGPDPERRASSLKSEARSTLEGAVESTASLEVPRAEADVMTTNGLDFKNETLIGTIGFEINTQKAIESATVAGLPDPNKLDLERTSRLELKSSTSHDLGPPTRSKEDFAGALKELQERWLVLSKREESKQEMDPQEDSSKQHASRPLETPPAYPEKSVDPRDEEIRTALSTARRSLRRQAINQDPNKDPSKFCRPHMYERPEPLPYSSLRVPIEVDSDGLVTAAKTGDVVKFELLLRKFSPFKVALDSKGPLTVALLTAALNGHNNIVELYPTESGLYCHQYKEHVKFSGVSHFNITPLHAAALNDHPKMVRLLLSRGANKILADEDGWTPLHAAAARGCAEAAKELLLESNASMNHRTNFKLSTDNPANTVQNTSLGKRQHRYGGTGKDLELVGRCTPLFLAAASGCPTVAQILIEKGAALSKSQYKLSPLHAACGLNNDLNWDWIRKLIGPHYPENEASFRELAVNCAYEPRNRRNVAENRDRARLLQMLLDYRCDPEDGSETGFLPIHFACLQNNSELVKILLEHKPFVNRRTKGRLNWTPLHLAVLCPNNDDTIDLLLEAGANFQALLGVPTFPRGTMTDKLVRRLSILRSLMPLGLAVYIENFQAAILLIKKAAALHEGSFLFMLSRVNILEIAVHTRRISALVLFSKQGINWRPKLTDAKIIPSKYSTSDHLPPEYRVDVNAVCNASTSKCTPLLRCLRFYPWSDAGDNKPRDSVVETLLDLGADVNARDEAGRSVLHYDCPLWVLRVLLNAGADIEAKDSFGRTPLLHTVYAGLSQYLRLLIQHGANINAKDNDGKSAWKLLSETCRFDILRRVDYFLGGDLPESSNGWEKRFILDQAKKGRMPVALPPYALPKNEKGAIDKTLRKYDVLQPSADTVSVKGAESTTDGTSENAEASEKSAENLVKGELGPRRRFSVRRSKHAVEEAARKSDALDGGGRRQ